MKLRMSCHGCGEDVSGSRRAVIHHEYVEHARVARQRQEWEAKHPPDPILGVQIVTGDALLEYPEPARWLMNRPDRGWAESGVIWPWGDLARLGGWQVDSRRYRDEHSEGFWLHATRRLLTGGAYIYGVGDPIPTPERT